MSTAAYFYFRNGGADEVYLGSADLMPRNLNRRVEVLFPVASPRLVARLRDEILATYIEDRAAARHMHSDGSYTAKSAGDGLDSQARFLGQRGSRPEPITQPVPPMPACIVVDPELAGEKTVLSALASRVAADLALCFVTAAEDIRRRALRA